MSVEQQTWDQGSHASMAYAFLVVDLPKIYCVACKHRLTLDDSGHAVTDLLRNMAVLRESSDFLLLMVNLETKRVSRLKRTLDTPSKASPVAMLLKHAPDEHVQVWEFMGELVGQ